MFKSVTRVATSAPLSRALPTQHAARRLVSTAPPHKLSRSWRNSALRWGVAGTLVYYYNTTSVFAEEPAYAVHAPPQTSPETDAEQTVASISDQRRAQSRAQDTSSPTKTHSEAVATIPDGQGAVQGSPAALEEEASQEGAFNEETGEINWDCPCLGGMAYGPCGEQFRTAFSCFVFSKEEPKGMDCIEHFKGMQNCFREHPDVYGAELDDDEAPADEVEGQNAPAQSEPAAQPIDAVAQSPSRQGDTGADASRQNIPQNTSPVARE